LLSAKSIKPGQSGQIEASVKTEGVAGKINKTITVVSNDPRQPQVQLTITALVEQEFPLSDQSLYFGAVPKGKEVVKELTITIPPGKKILSVESTDQNVTVKLVPGADGKDAKVVAVQRSDAKEGYHFGNLVIKTTSASTPEIKVQVRGTITAAQAN